MEFLQLAREKMKLVELDEAFMNRSVNEGFSGGEKKRNEIFQMAVLDPKLAILDETDSGLDIDALRIVAEGVNALRSEKHSVLVITHYQRLLKYLVPDFVHVLADGRIVKSGGKELAEELEQKGYEWIEEEVRGRAMSSVLEDRSTIAPVHIDGEPERVRRIREQAAERFNMLGWPTTRSEEWKYTSLASLTNIDWKTDERLPDDKTDSASPFGDKPVAELMFVNGALYANRATLANEHPGIRVMPIREAMESESFTQHFARYADYEKHALTALNTAMWQRRRVHRDRAGHHGRRIHPHLSTSAAALRSIRSCRITATSSSPDAEARSPSSNRSSARERTLRTRSPRSWPATARSSITTNSRTSRSTPFTSEPCRFTRSARRT